MFPHNVPLPEPRISAWLLGGGMHLLHLMVRISQVNDVPDSDSGWEDMYREHEGSSWFDWVCVEFKRLNVPNSSLDNSYDTATHHGFCPECFLSIHAHPTLPFTPPYRPSEIGRAHV